MFESLHQSAYRMFASSSAVKTISLNNPTNIRSCLKTRILLDTNVWRYLAEVGAHGRILALLRTGLIELQIAPASVLEVLRYENQMVRAAALRLMTDHRLTRLMPDAFSESMEILGEIRSFRPDWLRQEPNLDFFKRATKDWTRRQGGFWVRCSRTAASEAAWRGATEEVIHAAAIVERKRGREQMIVAKHIEPIGRMPLVVFSKPTPGWRGDPIEFWRLDRLTRVSCGLAREGDPRRDWMGPFVETEGGLLFSSAWVEFWCYLARAEAMPRQWLRAAHAFAQRFRKLSNGSGGDEQLLTYLPDTDLFVSADKGLVRIVEDYREAAPFLLPRSELIVAGPPGVDQLFSILALEAAT